MKAIKRFFPAVLPLLLLLPAMTDQKDLTTEEQNWVAMLEEEKLARDVYEYFFDNWNKQIFSNIARSEAQHMEQVKGILETKGYALPTGDEAGKFAVAEFQTLYDELSSRGSKSLEAALNVGGWIEEKDIVDLQNMIADEVDAATKQVLESLLQASHNHLRAFDRQLGGEYSPQILSPDAFEAIINQAPAAGMAAGGHGKGMMMGKGMGKGKCSGNCGGSCGSGGCKGGGCKSGSSH